MVHAVAIPAPAAGARSYGSVITKKNSTAAKLNSTNNRMELTAAIEALRALTRPCQVILTTDSVYVKDGITKWIHGLVKKRLEDSSQETRQKC